MDYQDTPADPATYLPPEVQPYCTGCDKTPEEIDEYIMAGRYEQMTPSDYVRSEEGTYNPANGHFLCTDCYMRAGMPSGGDGHGGPGRWIAP
jgi:hypothetical protein